MERFVSLSCPSCNATVPVDVSHKKTLCTYCGREFANTEHPNAPEYENYQKYQNEKQLQGDDW